MKITNENIQNLVKQYFKNKTKLHPSLQYIGGWDVSNVTNMNKLFKNNNFNEPLNYWDVSNVTNMEEMFANCINYNQPLNNWNVSNVQI